MWDNRSSQVLTILKINPEEASSNHLAFTERQEPAQDHSHHAADRVLLLPLWCPCTPNAWEHEAAEDGLQQGKVASYSYCERGSGLLELPHF